MSERTSASCEHSLPPIEQEELDAFTQLRVDTHAEMEAELQARLRSNPHPTAVEFTMGAFVEELEPQVRGAVIELRRKGYATHSSGFYGRWGEFQCIDGPFKIPLGVRKKLRAEGFEVVGGWPCSPVARILFWPPEPNLDRIRGTWDWWVAAVLPDKGRPAPTTRTWGGDRFRAQ